MIQRLRFGLNAAQTAVIVMDRDGKHLAVVPLTRVQDAVDDSENDLRLVRDILAVIRALRQQLGRRPTKTEIRDAMQGQDFDI